MARRRGSSTGSENVVRFAQRRRQRRAPRLPWRNFSGLAGVLVMLACWALQGPVKTALPGIEFEGRAVRVVDGDTLRIAGIGAPVRLWGVDAPERNERGGPEATALLRREALGHALACKEMAVDRYQRIVARCLRADTGEDISERMIESGLADEYMHYTGGFYQWRRLGRKSSRD